MKNTLPANSINLTSETIKNFATANCAVILDKTGDCRVCVGDMTIHEKITPDLIKRNESFLKNAPIVVIDANLTLEAIETVLKICQKHKKPSECFIFSLYLYCYLFWSRKYKRYNISL